MKIRAFISQNPTVVVLAVALIIFGLSFYLTTPSNSPTMPTVRGNSSYRLAQNERTVLNASVTTTAGSSMNVADFNLLGFTVGTQASSGTIKFACSMSDTAPTFSSSQSATNRWTYVDVTDVQDEASIDGLVGLTFVNSTTVRQVVIRNSNYRWCTALHTWTAGTTTVKMLTATNQ